METSPRKLDQKFTYEDYLLWKDDRERWELIDGTAYDMSPAPRLEHQRIIGKLFRFISEITDEGKCETFIAPFDVRLPGGFNTDSDIDTVVQPDISVFCDKTKLDERGGNGAPDLIIEILSPSTASKDLKEKFFLYERVGVKEYWVVDPSNRTLTVFVLGEDRKYTRGVVYTGEDVLKTVMFEDLEIRMDELFKEGV